MATLFLWIVVLALLAIWSLTVWAGHAAAVWAVAQAGTFSGSVTDMAALTLPPWLALWVPRELLEWLPRMLADLAPLLDGLLQAVPGLAGGLTAVAWLLWVLGALPLALLGVGLQMLLIARVMKQDVSSRACGFPS
ncbi:MAG: hypothetical protein RL654_1553 [Pseudomonadota bacterium]|jgi:hypothetical protein